MNHLIHSTLNFYYVPGTGDTTVNKTDRSKFLFYSVSANTIGGMEFKLCVLELFIKSDCRKVPVEIGRPFPQKVNPRFWGVFSEV